MDNMFSYFLKMPYDGIAVLRFWSLTGKVLFRNRERSMFIR